MTINQKSVVIKDPRLPLISIVTPSYNQGIFIEETINSVLNQDYPNIEYWVVDAESSDNTHEIINKYKDDPRFNFIIEKDSGQSDAINKGLRLVSGEILAYINSDDTYDLNAFNTISKAFIENPEIDIVYGNCTIVDEKSKHIGMYGNEIGYSSYKTTNFQQLISRCDSLAQPAAFWRRSLTNKIGLFDETLNYAMDYDFFIRCFQKNPGKYINTTIANFRLHNLSKTVSKEEFHWRESLNVSIRYGLKQWHIWYLIRVTRHSIKRNIQRFKSIDV